MGQSMNQPGKDGTIMELKLMEQCLEAYGIGGEVTVPQEETAETIVPDYCPDIARIIRTEGMVFLHSRELQDGKAEVSGTIRISVLYTPEGESGIRALRFAMPFTAEGDGHTLPGCTCLMAHTDLEMVESRMLNPRKIFTHCKLSTHMTGYRKSRLQICGDVDAEESLCVERKTETQHVDLLTRIVEKDFTFTDHFHLSPGRPGAAEILSASILSNVTEQKIVGSKLLLKGLFYLRLLYRDGEGQSCAASGELPFSQIMELDGSAEDASLHLDLQLTGIDLQLDGDDSEGRDIAVTLYFHVTAMLREERELTILSDLYSTNYDLTYEAQPLSLTSFCEHSVRRQKVREMIEIGVVAQSILCVSADCGAVSVNWEGDNAVLRTSISIRALYLDEGGACLVAERCIDVSCQAEFPPECTLRVEARCSEEVQSSLGDRGIEVRFPVDFHVEACSSSKKVCITSATLNDETPKDVSGAPSLVLRCMGRQERAWDLAKKYNTTIAAILAANQIESESELPAEKLLLIPRRRA